MITDRIKMAVGRLVASLSPKTFFRLAYLHNRGRWPSFKHPKDLSEIWIAYLLSGKVHENYWLADKYLVRKYVEEKGLGDILTPLIAVYDKPEEIEWDKLPDRFAIKLNYGAGMNIICKSKSNLDKNMIVAKLRKWLDCPKSYSFSESHYNLIERKIIIEDFIDDGYGGFPLDYKFICLHGRAVCVLVCSNRESGHANYSPYSPEWQQLPHYDKEGSLTAISRPNNLEKLINVAEQLAKGLDMVRVDLYSNGQRVWFGEMTLTPAGCIFHTWTQQSLDEMGKQYRSMIR